MTKDQEIATDLAGIVDNYLNGDARAEGEPEEFTFLVMISRNGSDRTDVVTNAEPEHIRKVCNALADNMPDGTVEMSVDTNRSLQ